MDVSGAVRANGEKTEIDVIVSPRASLSGIEGYDEWRKRIIVKVKSPPLEGRANKEVAQIFTEIFGTRSDVIAGLTSHQKRVSVICDSNTVIKKLESILNGKS